MPASDKQDVAIMLAAGRGARMGGPKALMSVGGQPWWRMQRERLRAAAVRDVWVVSPAVHEALRVEPDAPEHQPISDPAAPMFSSVVAGLFAVRGATPHGVFLLPVDVPAPSVEVWQALRASERPARPQLDGRHGHPAWLPWSFVERAILPHAADPNWVAATRLDRLIDSEVVEVEVHDPMVLVNLNTPEEVERWLAMRKGRR